jgi:hypothetical protein
MQAFIRTKMPDILQNFYSISGHENSTSEQNCSQKFFFVIFIRQYHFTELFFLRKSTINALYSDVIATCSDNYRKCQCYPIRLKVLTPYPINIRNSAACTLANIYEIEHIFISVTFLGSDTPPLFAAAISIRKLPGLDMVISCFFLITTSHSLPLSLLLFYCFHGISQELKNLSLVNLL